MPAAHEKLKLSQGFTKHLLMAGLPAHLRNNSEAILVSIHIHPVRTAVLNGLGQIRPFGYAGS